MTQALIIGMCGYKGSGKDTAAKIVNKLCNDEGIVYCQYSFAAAIRAMCAQLFGHHEVWYDDSQKEVPQDWLSGATPRDKLRDLGMVVRKYDKDFWARIVIEQISTSVKMQEIGGSRSVHVITDLRFWNEWNWLSKIDGTIMYVERGFKDDGHESEDLSWLVGVPTSKRIALVNDSTLEVFTEVVRSRTSHMLRL